MSTLNPRACVFPHLGKIEREILLMMCDGAYLQKFSEDMMPNEYALVCNDGLDHHDVPKKRFENIVKKYSEHLIGKRCRPSVGITNIEYRFRPELIEEAKLILS